jgi:hypothetical protein
MNNNTKIRVPDDIGITVQILFWRGAAGFAFLTINLLAFWYIILDSNHHALMKIGMMAVNTFLWLIGFFFIFGNSYTDGVSLNKIKKN